MTVSPSADPSALLYSPFGNLTTSDVVCDAEPTAESGGEKAEGLVVLGTLLVIAASFVSCIGVNLQKLAHNKNEMRQRAGRPGQRMTLMWRWWLGIICMVLGSLMDLAALPFVPLSRVAALGASGIVANVIITPLMLKEKLTRHDLVGCLIITVGTALACYFGAAGERSVDSHCILVYFTESAFIAFGTILFVVLLGLYYFIAGFRAIELHAREYGFIGGGKQRERVPSVGSADAAQSGENAARPCCLDTIWLHEHLAEFQDKVPRLPKWVFITQFGPQFYPSVHAVFAGAIGAQSVMFSKAVLIFLGNAFSREDTGKSVGLCIAFIIPTVFCLYNQIGQLNRALKIYPDAIFVMPVYQAVWICVGIASGLIFYQEYRHFSGTRAILFGVGIITSLIGLFILTNRKSRGKTAGKRGHEPIDNQRIREGAAMTPVATPIYNGIEPQSLPLSVSPPQRTVSGGCAAPPANLEANEEGAELACIEESEPVNLWLGSAAASALFQYSEQNIPSTPVGSVRAGSARSGNTPGNRGSLGVNLQRWFGGASPEPSHVQPDQPKSPAWAAHRSPSEGRLDLTPHSTPVHESRTPPDQGVDV